jgi:Tol biopolymer transport system component
MTATACSSRIARGRRERQVLASDGLYTRVSTWSPDGTRVAFSRGDHAAPDRDIFSIRIDGTDMTNITRSPSLDAFGPKGSPDGTRIAFTAYDHTPTTLNDSTSNVWIMNPDGSGQRDLTRRPGTPSKVPTTGRRTAASFFGARAAPLICS